MKDISLENFKSGFNLIAELVISLDNDKKAILKPRNEIVAFLDCNPPEVQLFILEELLEVYNYRAISESYLVNDDIEGGQKFPFEGFYRYKLESVKSKLKRNKIIENGKSIEHIKDKLKGFIGKNAKINYLLENKEYLEGDYPKDIEEILTNDPVYLFIKKKLKFWEKYNEISSDAEAIKIKPLPQLSTNLTIGQRSKLFELLRDDKFIPDKNKESLIWAFGTPDEKQPEHWQPITWDKSKQVLRELLEGIKKDEVTKAEMERITPKLFFKNDVRFELAKNRIRKNKEKKIVETIDQRRLKKILAAILNG